uniref:protein-tyrosine sulfotransferase n=1 Tax=Trebouxia lynnae TaxID=1825957 RepID=A0A6G6VXG0_9CHLO|nr:sulfotransferase-like protein [Trebouxia lynnae]
MQGNMSEQSGVMRRIPLLLSHQLLRPLLLLCMLTSAWTQNQTPYHQALSFSQQEQAATRLRGQIADSPDNPNLHLELATILHGLDQLHPNGGRRIPEAERAYREAIRLTTPQQRMGLYTNLGALLMGSDHIDDCLAALKQALALALEYRQTDSYLYAGALFNLGKALGMQGKAEEASKAYGQAIEASRGVHGSTYNKALASLKKFTPHQVAEMEEAASLLKQLQGSQDAPQEGKKRKRRSRSADKELQQKWAFLTELDAVDRSWLHFALFSAYQSLKQWDKAWGSLAEANRLQKLTSDYAPENDAALINIMQQVFPRQPAPLQAGSEAYDILMNGVAGYPDPSPIFVVGMPRSGSTLVEHILSSHPLAHGAGEDTAFAPLIPRLLRLLDGKGQFQELREIGKQYVQDMRLKVPPSRSNATHVVDKMLRNAWNVGYISMLLPQACIIQVVRHPMDTALSCYVQPFEGRGTPWAWDLQDIASEMLLLDEISQHWQNIFPGRVLVMPYERIVVDLESAARQMLSHCGLPWNDDVLQFHQNQRTVQTASLAQVRQKLYRSSIGKWKQYSEHVQVAADKLQALVQRYERDYSAYLQMPVTSGKDEL